MIPNAEILIRYDCMKGSKIIATTIIEIMIHAKSAGMVEIMPCIG
jgi:hypothetical protein